MEESVGQQPLFRLETKSQLRTIVFKGIVFQWRLLMMALISQSHTAVMVASHGKLLLTSGVTLTTSKCNVQLTIVFSMWIQRRSRPSLCTAQIPEKLGKARRFLVARSP